MDRVLLIIDDIQYTSHLEMTLRKVGFDVETMSSEYNLQEKLLTFNPDYVIAKGLSARVSTINIGKKLKESTKFLGKVILIFPEDQKSTPDEFIKLRMDLLLFEPISALRLVTHLLNLTQLDKESILDKLLRLAHTDPQFRMMETQILGRMGSTIDSEIKIITGGSSQESSEMVGERINEDDLLTFVQPDLKKLNKEDFEPTEAVKTRIQAELDALNQELPLRIESYNRAIKTVDQDLKKGHNKRQTRATNKKLFSEIPDAKRDEQDEERRKFVKALVKK